MVRPPPSHVSGIGKAQFGGLSYALGKQKQRRRNGLSLKTQLDVRVLLQLPTALSSISPTCLLTLKEGKKELVFPCYPLFFFSACFSSGLLQSNLLVWLVVLQREHFYLHLIEASFGTLRLFYVASFLL